MFFYVVRVLMRFSRYLSGLEALSLQGVHPACHTTTNGIMTDSEYMSLAGNAFNAGSFVLMMIAGLSTMTLPESL